MTDRQLPKKDDWANTVTGLGGPVDKNQYAYFQNLPWLQETELDNLYENNALAARIVDRLPDDAIRTGFTLTGKDKEFDWSSLNSDLENHSVLQNLSKGWKQARLYAGSLAVLALNDGRKYDEPLDWNNLTGLQGIRIIPSIRARPVQIGKGLGSDSYLRPEFYLITTNGKQKKIHWSRCIRFEGVPELGDHRKVVRNGWGISVLQRVYRELSNLGQVEGYSANLMHELSVWHWQIEGLYEKMCGGDDQKQAVQQMVEQTKALMDILHVLLTDKNDNVSELKRDVSGVDKLLEKFVEALIRATDMPRLILLGEQPGGLNTSADGETRGWYDFVDAKRKDYLNGKLNYLLRIFFKIRENKGLVVPKDWSIEWGKLWQPSADEQAETTLKEMQAAQVATTQGYAKPGEIRLKLISEGKIQASLEEEEEETESQTQPLQVGTFQGILQMATAIAQGFLEPAQARALLGQSAPQFAGNEALQKQIFPDRDPSKPSMTPNAGAVPSNPLMGPTPEVGADVEGTEPVAPAAAPSTEPVPPDLLNTKEAAAMLGVPTLTINNLCRKGELPYWQFGSRVQVSMGDLLKHGKRGDSRKYFDCKPRRDAKALGIFVRIPQSFVSENNLPPLIHDGAPSPHHCTLLVMDSVHGEMEDFIATVKSTLAGVGPIQGKVTGVEKFSPSGIPVATLDFDKDLSIFRTILINVLKMRGWEVSEKFPIWQPHVTLSYSPIQSDDLPRVKGTFDFAELEIWGYGDPVKVPLS